MRMAEVKLCLRIGGCVEQWRTCCCSGSSRMPSKLFMMPSLSRKDASWSASSLSRTSVRTTPDAGCPGKKICARTGAATGQAAATSSYARLHRLLARAGGGSAAAQDSACTAAWRCYVPRAQFSAYLYLVVANVRALTSAIGLRNVDGGVQCVILDVRVEVRGEAARQ